MSFVNVPEAPGSTGQNIESVIVTSSQHRQTFTVGSFNTTAMAPVTSSGGLLIHVTNPSTAVTITNTTTAVSLSSAAALSSGTVTLSSVHTVTATAGTNPWSSAPGFNIPFVSASSGALQISGTPLVNIVGTSSGVAPVTTSGGLGVTILGGAAGSTTVNLSSATALSSGTVTLSSVHTVTATAGTNPWSSAPGFNIPFVSASSGLLQISGTPLVNIVGTSSGVAPVTTSGGLSVTIVSGGDNVAVITTSGGFLTATTSYGLKVQSTQPVSLTSGTVTLSSVHTVTATAATNPWSSAPGFNMPVVNNSSGVVQSIGSTNRVYSAFSFGASSSASYTAISTVARVLYGWNVGSQAAGQTCIRMYNSTSTTLGSTSNLIVAIPIPGSTGLGAGNNMMLPEGITFASVMTFMIVDNFSATSTALGTHSDGDLTGTFYYI